MTGPELPAPDRSASRMESLLEAVRNELFSIPGDIAERVTEPLCTALRQAAEVHAELIAPIESECEAGRIIEAIELARFRASASSDFSEYLCDTVRTLDAGNVVGSIFVDRVQRLLQIVTDAPESTSSEVESSTPPTQLDGSARRGMRKIWLRMIRRFRAWRSHAPLERNATLREIRESELSQQLVEDMLPVYESLQQSVAQRHAALERDLTDWSFGVLELDDDFGLHDLVAQQSGKPSLEVDAEPTNNPEPENGRNVERVTAAVARMVIQDSDLLLESISEQLEKVLRGIAAELPNVLQAAGTPIMRSARRVLPLTDDPEPVSWKNRRELWARWHTQVLNRLVLNHSVLVFRDELAHQATKMLGETRHAALEPVLAAFEAAQGWLESAGPRLEAAFDQEVSGNANNLGETIAVVDREADLELKRLFDETILRNAQTVLTAPGAAQWLDLTSAVKKLPYDLTVHSHSYHQDSHVDPGTKTFSVDLREIAQSALAPDWPSLLSEKAEPLKAGITRSFVGAEKLQNIISFNFGAAINEMREPSEPDVKGEVAQYPGDAASASSPIETARELAAGALRRSGELVDDLRISLDEPWLEFARAFDAAVYGDWHDLVSQVQSDDMLSERWIGMRTRSLRNFERLIDRGWSQWEKGLAWARQRNSAFRRLANRLIRRGRTAVGLDDATKGDESTIADGLRSADDVQKNLPLVYRRLFTLGSVAEPSLLQGRGRDLVNVRQRFERWRSGRGLGTHILTGPIGAGRTSFLEALQAKVFDGCAVHLLEMDDRSAASERLVRAIAEKLSLSREVRTLSDLASQLGKREVSEKPTVVLLDNLEHLMLQSTGGTALLQELLGVMVRSDRCVFWLATMSAPAWKYFEKVAGMSAAGVRSLALGAIGRKETEDIVLGRHHRSGITLRFTPPKDPSPILKRRLKSANTAVRAQEILNEVYFDNLFKHTNGSIELSLLYWLRSVEFEEDGDVVAVQPFEPINFEQINKLDLPRLFALKAFVLHNTLTACELATVLRVPLERSRLILEALFRFSLIEHVLSAETEPAETVDCIAERFRLSRRVVYPVVERLRGARILY